MKREYKVQFVYDYRNGMTQWWTLCTVETLDVAVQVKRREESLCPDEKFRIVCRKVTDWEECKEVAE